MSNEKKSKQIEENLGKKEREKAIERRRREKVGRRN